MNNIDARVYRNCKNTVIQQTERLARDNARLMSRSIFLILLLLPLSATFWSCGPATPSYQAQVSELDSLESNLLRVQERLNGFDEDRLIKSELTFKSHVEYMADNVLDSVDRETGMFISRYRRLKKGFNGFDRKRRSYRQELTYALAQLTTLRNDLKHGVVAPMTEENANDGASSEEEVANYYVRVEKEAAMVLISDVDSWLDGVLSILELFDELNPQAEEFVAQIKTNAAA